MDRFKDNFRTQKKQDALEVLYTLIHGCGREKQAERDVDTDAMDKIHAFEKLRLYADPSQQDRFVMDFDITQTQIKFWIDGEVISKCSLQRLLNLSDNYVLKPMTDEEEELFLKYVLTMVGLFLSSQNCYKIWLSNLEMPLAKMKVSWMNFISLCDLEKIEKCHALNGTVRLLLTRKKNYAAFVWVLMTLVPNFLKWVTGKVVMGKSYLKWFIQRFFICYEGIRRH